MNILGSGTSLVLYFGRIVNGEWRLTKSEHGDNVPIGRQRRHDKQVIYMAFYVTFKRNAHEN